MKKRESVPIDSIKILELINSNSTFSGNMDLQAHEETEVFSVPQRPESPPGSREAKLEEEVRKLRSENQNLKNEAGFRSDSLPWHPRQPRRRGRPVNPKIELRRDNAREIMKSRADWRNIEKLGQLCERNSDANVPLPVRRDPPHGSDPNDWHELKKQLSSKRRPQRVVSILNTLQREARISRSRGKMKR